MDTFPLALTILLVALASGLAVALVRARREARRRTDARVAALTRLAAAEAPIEWADEEPSLAAADLDPAPEKESASPWGMRLGIAGGLVLIAVAAVAAASMRSPRTEASLDRPPVQSQGTGPQLELLALDHTNERGGLTVAGQVRNPNGVVTTPDAIATVFLFGTDGAFVASGRVPLDTAALNSGAASSFSVSIAVTGPVARYRVSFRDVTGLALTHLDTRSSARVARNQ